MARSKLEPCLGTEAGDRLTVILLPGRGNLEFVAAALTLAAASFTEASGSPTKTNAGKLLEMSVSTSMIRPVSPKRLIDKVFASNSKHLLKVFELNLAPIDKNRDGIDSNIDSRKLAGATPLTNQPP
jgi:hypothetical protein